MLATEKKYLTLKEKERVLQEVELLRESLIDAMRTPSRRGSDGRDLAWLERIPHNIRAGYIFQKDVSRLERLLERHQIQ
jgi:hypothetical protein